MHGRVWVACMGKSECTLKVRFTIAAVMMSTNMAESMDDLEEQEISIFKEKLNDLVRTIAISTAL